MLALIAGMSTAKRGDTAVMRQEAYQLAYVAVSAFCWTADVVGHTDGICDLTNAGIQSSNTKLGLVVVSTLATVGLHPRYKKRQQQVWPSEAGIARNNIHLYPASAPIADCGHKFDASRARCLRPISQS